MRALIVILALLSVSAAVPPVVKQPGFRYTALENHGCDVFVHPKDYWRPRRELHVACTARAGARRGGVTLEYTYPKEGTPRTFGVVIEDRTHGQYGDIPFITAWLDGTTGYVHIPGPIPEHPNGIYVHVEHAYFNAFEGVVEDRYVTQ